MADVLFLTQVLPYPLDAGPKIRAYYVLRHLAKDHQVTLLSFVRDEDRPEHVEHLEAFCEAVFTVPMRRSRPRDGWAAVKALYQRIPVIIARDEIGAMKAVIGNILAEHSFDVIHADQTSMAQYGQYALTCVPQQMPRPKTLLDAHNALFRVFEHLATEERNALKRSLYLGEARALEKYEQRVYDQFDQVVFVSGEDRSSLGRALADERTMTIPICIDPSDSPLVDLAPEPRLVTHMGTMFWPPNVDAVLWFAQAVWPLVTARVSDARFVVVGKRPPASVQALADADPSIEVLGYVEDPNPILQETAAFVVPLRAGAGMRVKIIDAWCWGVPIVSTTIGAESITVRDGEDILIADEPEPMAQSIVRLLGDPTLRTALRETGRAGVMERYDWRRVYRQWDSAYNMLLSDREPSERTGDDSC